MPTTLTLLQSAAAASPAATHEHTGFLPHGFCYLWDPRLVSLHAISDTLIGLSYVAISMSLMYLVYKGRREIPFGPMAVAFGVFIIACGATHFVEVLTLWRPAYWFSAYVKLATALSSVATAIALPRLIPVALRTVRDARESEERRVRLAAADEANRVKSEFMAVMSHELRTPLNAILGYTELIDQEVAGPVTAQQRGFLARLRASAAHLLGLIDQVLNFERSQAGRDELLLEPVDVDAVLSDAVAQLAPAAFGKGLGLTASVAPGARVVTDAAKLRQIALNLLSNAVKYTDVGEVALRAAVDARGLTLEVRDTGVGIAPEHRDRIFDAFWQADQRLTRRVGGSGLGLSIVQRFVRRLGGTIEVRSAPGAGSAFTVWLPSSPPHATPGRPALAPPAAATAPA
jgi:signal transduction histidine kinase